MQLSADQISDEIVTPTPKHIETVIMELCWEKLSSYKQDSIWSWFICFFTAICMILSVGFSFALGVLFPVFMNYFDENREKTAWVSSIIIGAICFLGPVSSTILNRFGIRVTTILGCLSCAVGLALGSFAPNITILYVTFSLPFGTGVSAIYVVSPIIVYQYFLKKRSFALGIVTAGQGMGTMILGPTLQALVDVFGWKNSFRLFAGILAVASLTGVILHRKSTSSVFGEEDEARGKKFGFNLWLLRDPVIITIVLRNGLTVYTRLVPYVHIIKYCDDLGIPADKSSLLYLFMGIFATIGRLGGGFLCNLRFIKARFLHQAVSFVTGVSTMLLPLATTYAGLIAFVIIFSVADGIMITTIIIECMESVDESKRVSTFGFLLMAAGVFALGSPPLSGFMADKFGNYFAAFLMAGGVAIVASLIPFLLICVKQEQKKNFVDDVEETVHSGQLEGVDDTELKSKSWSQDSISTIGRDRLRSSSFATAMNSPMF